jgi:hypothetical protein
VKILQNKSMLRIVLQRPEVSSTWLLSFVLDNWHLINGGHWEIIEWLLAANADPNGLDKGMFIKVLERGFTEPLHKLRLRWVEMFIEHGANVNYGDCIPLMMAVRENDLEMVQLLVRYGAKHVGEVLQVIHNRRGYAEIRSFFKQLIINRVGWWNYMTGNYDIHD